MNVNDQQTQEKNYKIIKIRQKKKIKKINIEKKQLNILETHN